jgi:Protein of unknown function (DUF3606)
VNCGTDGVLRRYPSEEAQQIVDMPEVGMADNTGKRGPADRRKVAAGQDHEVRYLGEKYGLSADQAKALIEQRGNSRAKLDAAARKLSD